MKLSLLLACLALPLLSHASSDMPAGTVEAVTGSLVATAVTPEPSGVPELSLERLGSLFVQAVTGKHWSLLAALLVVGLVFALRRLATSVGGKFAWFATPKGSVLLTTLAGTGSLLAIALGQGQPFTFGLLVSCLMTAASASGLWSWGQTVSRPTMAPPICTPAEVANGTCKP